MKLGGIYVPDKIEFTELFLALYKCGECIEHFCYKEIHWLYIIAYRKDSKDFYCPSFYEIQKDTQGFLKLIDTGGYEHELHLFEMNMTAGALLLSCLPFCPGARFGSDKHHK